VVSFGVFSLSGGVWVSFVVVGEGELAGELEEVGGSCELRG
jgi:hypothetical protein